MNSELDSSDTSDANISSLDESLLVSEIAAGSDKAWHDFVARYSGLILAVIRRQLFEVDEDRIRTIYVEILAALYNGALKKFRAESSLSTWLIVYSRNRARDYLRKLYGRSVESTGYSKLNKRDRLVFRLFYVEMLPLEAIMLQLRWNEPEITIDRIVNSICRIEKVMNARYLKNLADKNQARRHGIRSVKLARYLIDISVRDDIYLRYVKPDSALLERETEQSVRELREKIAELHEDERKILYLRFDKGLSAKEIAEEMDIGEQRRVYTIIDRILRKLRKSMGTE
jgi:DNA-directed RNA polymerase specialized sigma24 family protein